MKLTQSFDSNHMSWQMGDCLRDARKEAGLTQIELAKKLNTHQPAIARAERGNISSVRWLQKALKACGFEISGYLNINSID